LLKIGQFDFKNTNAYVNYEQESEESSDSPDEEGSTQSSESEEDDIRKITSHRRHTRKEKISKTEPKTDNGQPKMQHHWLYWVLKNFGYMSKKYH